MGLSDIFNKHTALNALFTIGFGFFTADNLMIMANHGFGMRGVLSTLITGAIAGYSANNWKRQVTGRGFFD